MIEMEKKQKDRLLTMPEVAEYVGYSLGHVRNIVWRNQLPVIRLSKRAARIRQSDLERWIEGHRHSF